jgi:hypothetical protein
MGGTTPPVPVPPSDEDGPGSALGADDGSSVGVGVGVGSAVGMDVG